jgi:methylated-DNA-[protein]-cysteine S-methyltransferase
MPDDPEIRHFIFSTCFGFAAIAYREQPFLIINISLPRTNRKDLFESIKSKGWGKRGRHPEALRISEAIVDYFTGKPIQPYWDYISMSGLTNYQQSVLAATTEIPYGALRSYQAIAVATGRPRAYRSVGSALAKNPFPILIPCHRVIRNDNTIGQFGGGVALKRRLIELEAKHAGRINRLLKL